MKSRRGIPPQLPEGQQDEVGSIGWSVGFMAGVPGGKECEGEQIDYYLGSGKMLTDLPENWYYKLRGAIRALR